MASTSKVLRNLADIIDIEYYMIGCFNVRINDMVRASFQKEQVNKSSRGFPSADDPNFIAPNEDPLRRVNPANRRIVSVSDEIKEKLAEISRSNYMERYGMTGTGEERPKLINAYLETIPREDRSAAAWTLNQFRLELADKYQAEIRKEYPNWNYGEPFDTSILEGFDPMKQHIDVTV